MPYGYRAAFVVLGTYLSQGRNTIERIISRWAPPSENNPERYIRNVERLSGILRNKPLTATDGTAYIQIVAAMCFVENGVNAELPQVWAGFHLQTKITAP